jgi:hypothetical protein
LIITGGADEVLDAALAKEELERKHHAALRAQ